MSPEYSNEQVLTFSFYFLIVEEGERSGANYGRYDSSAMCCNNVLCGIDHGVLELSIKEGRNLKAMVYIV